MLARAAVSVVALRAAHPARSRPCVSAHPWRVAVPARDPRDRRRPRWRSARAAGRGWPRPLPPFALPAVIVAGLDRARSSRSRLRGPYEDARRAAGRRELRRRGRDAHPAGRGAYDPGRRLPLHHVVRGPRPRPRRRLRHRRHGQPPHALVPALLCARTTRSRCDPLAPSRPGPRLRRAAAAPSSKRMALGANDPWVSFGLAGNRRLYARRPVARRRSSAATTPSAPTRPGTTSTSPRSAAAGGYGKETGSRSRACSRRTASSPPRRAASCRATRRDLRPADHRGHASTSARSSSATSSRTGAARRSNLRGWAGPTLRARLRGLRAREPRPLQPDRSLGRHPRLRPLRGRVPADADARLRHAHRQAQGPGAPPPLPAERSAHAARRELPHGGFPPAATTTRRAPMRRTTPSTGTPTGSRRTRSTRRSPTIAAPPSTTACGSASRIRQGGASPRGRRSRARRIRCCCSTAARRGRRAPTTCRRARWATSARRRCPCARGSRAGGSCWSTTSTYAADGRLGGFFHLDCAPQQVPRISRLRDLATMCRDGVLTEGKADPSAEMDGAMYVGSRKRGGAAIASLLLAFAVAAGCGGSGNNVAGSTTGSGGSTSASTSTTTSTGTGTATSTGTGMPEAGCGGTAGGGGGVTGVTGISGGLLDTLSFAIVGDTRPAERGRHGRLPHRRRHQDLAGRRGATRRGPRSPSPPATTSTPALRASTAAAQLEPLPRGARAASPTWSSPRWATTSAPGYTDSNCGRATPTASRQLHALHDARCSPRSA